MIDSLLTYYKGKLNLLSLMSYPFKIEIIHDSKVQFTFEAGTTIPTKKDFFIDEGSGVLRIRKIYLNEEKEHKVIIPGGLNHHIPASLDIDCSLSPKIILSIDQKTIEEGF